MVKFYKRLKYTSNDHIVLVIFFFFFFPSLPTALYIQRSWETTNAAPQERSPLTDRRLSLSYSTYKKNDKASVPTSTGSYPYPYHGSVVPVFLFFFSSHSTNDCIVHKDMALSFSPLISSLHLPHKEYKLISPFQQTT